MRNKIHTVYRNKAGERVCSVTTFLGVLGKPAIIHWAWEQGVAGLDYRKTRDIAGDTGTLVHYLILCLLKDEEPDLSEWSEAGLAAAACPMEKFKAWRAENELEPILLELPLVSEEFQFGGMPDFYGKVNGILTLLDFKTGVNVYQEAFYQTSAYKKLLEEHGHQVDAVKILRLGKSEDEGFEERAVGNLDKHFEVFLACQKIYNLQKAIGKNKAGFIE